MYDVTPLICSRTSVEQGENNAYTGAKTDICPSGTENNGLDTAGGSDTGTRRSDCTADTRHLDKKWGLRGKGESGSITGKGMKLSKTRQQGIAMQV